MSSQKLSLHLRRQEQQSGKMPRRDKATSCDCIASSLTKPWSKQEEDDYRTSSLIYAEVLLKPHSPNIRELIRLAEAVHQQMPRLFARTRDFSATIIESGKSCMTEAAKKSISWRYRTAAELSGMDAAPSTRIASCSLEVLVLPAALRYTGYQ